MTTMEQEILAIVHKLDVDSQRQVLEMLKTFVIQSSTEMPVTHKHNYTARELLRLPVNERNRLIQLAFDLIANEEFEIFDADELDELIEESDDVPHDGRHNAS